MDYDSALVVLYLGFRCLGGIDAWRCCVAILALRGLWWGIRVMVAIMLMVKCVCFKPSLLVVGFYKKKRRAMRVPCLDFRL